MPELNTVDLYALLYHLRACPDDFLLPPVGFDDGAVHTKALVLDVYRQMHGNLLVSNEALPPLDMDENLGINQAVSIQIGAWFFSHSVFQRQPQLLPGAEEFSFTYLPVVSRYVNGKDWIGDEDRSEEFVRLALHCCKLLPQGETEEEAADKFDALNTIKRRAVLHQSSEQMQRIKEIRQKMAEAKAREAANVYGRE